MAKFGLRVDRGAVQFHLDDTRSAQGQARGVSDNVDRRASFIEQSMDGGVGSDNKSRVRASRRRVADDADTGVSRLNSRASEQTDQFIASTRQAADRHIRPV